MHSNNVFVARARTTQQEGPVLLENHSSRYPGKKHNPTSLLPSRPAQQPLTMGVTTSTDGSDSLDTVDVSMVGFLHLVHLSAGQSVEQEDTAAFAGRHQHLTARGGGTGIVRGADNGTLLIRATWSASRKEKNAQK